MTASRSRGFLVVIGTLVIMLGTSLAHATDEPPSSLTGGGSASGPPAPAVPGIAATAAQPALPNAPVEPGVAAREEPVEPPPVDAKPRSVNLWPLFTYESDPAARTSHLAIFGPLLEYRSDAGRQQFHFRPFVSISQSRVGHDDDVSFLGPVLTSHWGQTEQTTKGLGGLFTYRTRTSEDGRTLESQRGGVLPFYFYEWDNPERWGRYSAFPLYADLDDFLGYDHVEMALFPAYVHLQGPSIDRYYYPYPLISRDGPEGSGYRLWPFPLRDRQGQRVGRGESETAPARQTHFPLLHDQLDATAAHDSDPS